MSWNTIKLMFDRNQAADRRLTSITKQVKAALPSNTTIVSSLHNRTEQGR